MGCCYIDFIHQDLQLNIYLEKALLHLLVMSILHLSLYDNKVMAESILYQLYKSKEFLKVLHRSNVLPLIRLTTVHL